MEKKEYGKICVPWLFALILFLKNMNLNSKQAPVRHSLQNSSAPSSL